jgi:hypothetical protein
MVFLGAATAPAHAASPFVLASARTDVALEYQGDNVFVHNRGNKPIVVSVGWEAYMGGRKVGGGAATWSPLKAHEKAFVGKTKTPSLVYKYRLTRAQYAR